jgi:hypothetical protein
MVGAGATEHAQVVGVRTVGGGLTVVAEDMGAFQVVQRINASFFQSRVGMSQGGTTPLILLVMCG